MTSRSQTPDPLTYDYLGPAAFVIPVPLVVLWRCDPRQLMVWVALRWLAEVFPEGERQGGPSYHLLAALCKLDRRSLPTIFAQLLNHQLVVDTGLSRVARSRAARPHHVIDADQVNALTRSHFAAILTHWHIPSARLPRRVPREHVYLFNSMTGPSGITVPNATGPSGITVPNATDPSGITVPNATGPSGIRYAEEHFTVAVQSYDPYMTIFVPLVVFDRCDPSELATWMTQCWLLTVNADTPMEIRATQVAAIATIGRGKLSAYYARLLNKRLLVHVGTAQAARNYSISQHRLLLLNAQEAGNILARWKVGSRAPSLSEQHHHQLLLSSIAGPSGITAPEATGPSGITRSQTPHPTPESTGPSGITAPEATGPSGISPSATSAASGINPAPNQPALKRKNRTKGDRDSILHDSVATPDGAPRLADHPLSLWERLHPQVPAADHERLRRCAQEHDAPHRAYGGGFGLYWLGRAIEATLANTDHPPTLRYVRGVLRSWRERTTDEVSAYGSDAPNYRRLTPRAGNAPVSAPAPDAVPISADLVALWQRILRQVAAGLPAAEFDTWLRDTVLVDLNATTAVVGVSNTFIRERVAATYACDLAAALGDALGRPIAEVELVIMEPP